MPLSTRNRIVAFLVLTYALSTIFYVQIASAGAMKMLPVLGLMWCPGVAALVVRLASQRNLRAVGWGWGATRWPIWCYVLPPAAGLLVYGIVWATGIGGFAPAALTLGTSARAARIPLPVTVGVLAT